MAGASLKFGNSYLGIERCSNPEDGKEYLRAVIFSAHTGNTSSGPVEIKDVQRFALDIFRQSLFVLGYTDDDLVNRGLEVLVEEVRADAATKAAIAEAQELFARLDEGPSPEEAP